MTARVSSPLLIGRAEQLARLRLALDEARAGNGGTILIAGEAGVGKTRLAAELVELAKRDGALSLQGGCIDVGDGALPFAPVVEALRGLVRSMPAEELDGLLGPARSELARLMPDLRPAAADDVSRASTESGQTRLFELLLGVVERLAATRPLVLVVEDLHWADRSTRDLVGFLVHNLRQAAVLLLLTYRSDELHRRHPLLPFLAELERSARVERIVLEPLDRRETAEQLRAIAGRELEPDLVDSIFARSGGNAFFAEELLVAAGDDGDAELPSTLRDVLLARVADLAEPTQDFLRIASAAGKRVDPELLAAAASFDDGALYDALRECVARQVMVPDPTAGAERYAFRHALLQEAVYDDLLPGERTRLHSAFARTLEARSGRDGSRAAELAYHWYAAHDLPGAFEASVAAAAAAEDRYAFPEAIAHRERALELWDQVPDAEMRAGRDRIALLADLARVTRYHAPARAVAHIQNAIRLVDATADPVRAGLLHERLGRFAWGAGEGGLSERAYRTAMELIPADRPSEPRARAVAGLAQILFLRARFDESRLLADEALALARAVGARDIEGHALNTRGVNRVMVGEIAEAIDDLQAALRIAEEVAKVDDVGRAYANWTWVLDMAGRSREALAVAEEGIATTERLGLMRFFGTHLLYWVGDCRYRLGRWEDAGRAVRRAEEVGPLGINEILVPELFGRLAVARGDFDEAARRLRPLGPLAERAAELQFVGPVQASLSELALWQGRPEDAAAEAGKAIDLLAATLDARTGELFALAIRAYADIAEVARARRDVAGERQAIAAAERLLQAVRDREAMVPAIRQAFEALSQAWAPLCEAEATRAQGRPDPDAWVACIGAWQQLERPYLVAYLQWREAEARLAARGDRASVASTLRAALLAAEALGAAPLVREIRGLAGRARIALDAGPAASPADELPAGDDEAERLGLTAREREVLALVALGRTNRQIADALFISENTAGVHVSNILGKLGVAGRGEAAAVAHRLGLDAPVHEAG